MRPHVYQLLILVLFEVTFLHHKSPVSFFCGINISSNYSISYIINTSYHGQAAKRVLQFKQSAVIRTTTTKRNY